MVSAEAVFLLLYANVLVWVALGLHRLGRVSASPWRSRVLAGHRRRHAGAGLAAPAPTAARGRVAATRPETWPHDAQPRLHTGIAMVAAAAGLVLTIAGLWRHHQNLERVLLAATATAICVVLARLSSHRSTVSAEGMSHTRSADGVAVRMRGSRTARHGPAGCGPLRLRGRA
jgi:hypothetical protein